MEPHDKLPSLQALQENIRRVQSKSTPVASSAPPQGMRYGLRMGVEFASGVLVGGGVGFMLDKWLNTSPVLFIVCFLLGAAGGFLTLYRTMKAMDKDVSAAPAPMQADDDDD